MQVLATVTLGYSRTVAWRATVHSARHVTWHAAPEIDPTLYGAPLEGHVRFVLTLDGKRIYDEDHRLYYPWLKADRSDGDAAGEGAATTAAEAAASTLHPRGRVSAAIATLLVRILLLVLLAALLWGAYISCSLLIAYVAVPLARLICRGPLTCCLLLVLAPVAAVAVRVAYRLATEDVVDVDDDAEGEAT
jgi:hypothetical protein